MVQWRNAIPTQVHVQGSAVRKIILGIHIRTECLTHTNKSGHVIYAIDVWERVHTCRARGVLSFMKK